MALALALALAGAGARGAALQVPAFAPAAFFFSWVRYAPRKLNISGQKEKKKAPAGLSSRRLLSFPRGT